MKTPAIFLAACVVILLISGCSSEPKVMIVDNSANVKTAEVQLADAADSVSKSLQELAEIERATHPNARLPSPVEPEMIGMGQLASIDWSGPVGPLVKKIADAAHYKMHVLGTAPAIPILVSIVARDTPLSDILRDINFQCNNKATIVIYPASKIIELRYAKP